MLYVLLLPLAILLSKATAQMEKTCAKLHPIYVDIHNRTVDGATAKFQYGSFIGVGVPYQNQSLWSSLSRSETSFALTEFCKSSNLTDCINNTGGSVNYTASTTWKEDVNFESLDTEKDFEAIGGLDDVHLWTHYLYPSPASGTNITGMPVEYALSGNSNPGIAGLGLASTMMQSLVDQGHIGAKTYSLYIGNGMQSAGGQFAGSLTFGGYDSGRFQHPIHTYDMDLTQSDYLPVTVTDIIIDDPSRPQLSNKSIVADKESFEARITTDEYPMLFPAEVTQNFINLLGASHSSMSDGSLRVPSSFNGTMTIQLSDGFRITLSKETVVGLSGIALVQQNTNDNYTGPFYLSTAWLSQIYPMVDYESKIFHLAQVIQNGKYVIPVQMCAGDIPVPYDYSKHPSYWAKNGLTGALFGGLIAGTAVAIAIFELWRWRRKNKRAWKAKQPWDASVVWNMEVSTSTVDEQGMRMQEMNLSGTGKGWSTTDRHQAMYSRLSSSR